MDFTPIVRAIQATNPDVVLLASYPPDSVGMVRAATELGLKTQLFGGAMVGMQYASLIAQLSDKLNRVVNYHFFVPSPKMSFPGIEEFLKKYQAQAKDAGVDPLGFYQPPFAYAAMQVLEQAVTATGSLDDDKLAEYIHKNAFNTIVGEIKFNELGEWATPRVLMVQFQNIQGTGLEQYHDRPQAGDRLSGRIQGRGAGAAVLEVDSRCARSQGSIRCRSPPPSRASGSAPFVDRAGRADRSAAGRAAGARSWRAACARPISTGATATTARRCRRCSAMRAPAWSSRGRQGRDAASRRAITSSCRFPGAAPAPTAAARWNRIARKAST